MAKGMYICVDGVAKKGTKGYVGVDGVARKIKKGYVGVDGVARLFFSANTINYVYGSVTPSFSSSYSQTYTLSGIGFTPTHAIAVKYQDSITTLYTGTYGIKRLDSSDTTTTCATISGDSVTFTFTTQSEGFRKSKPIYYYVWREEE